jgi:predicted metal-binding membrane protein
MSIFFRVSIPPRIEKIILTGVFFLICILAWAVLYFNSDFAHMSHGFGHGHHAAHSKNFVVLFIAGWSVMTVAMMLPTTLPIIAFFHRISSQHKNRILLLILVLLGFIGTWLVFGILIFIQIKILTLFISTRPVLSSYSWTFAPLVILFAGLFQFSSLKYKCLDKCRSPLSFVMEHWQGSRDKWNALRLGIDHGIFCIGCCWALMLLMFVVGYGSLFWMLVLALVMGIEKNVRWGRKISKPVGFILIVAGLSMGALNYINI